MPISIFLAASTWLGDNLAKMNRHDQRRVQIQNSDDSVSICDENDIRINRSLSVCLSEHYNGLGETTSMGLPIKRKDGCMCVARRSTLPERLLIVLGEALATSNTSIMTVRDEVTLITPPRNRSCHALASESFGESSLVH